MFEVQAGEGPACAEVFSAAGVGYRKSGIGLTQRAEHSSAAGIFYNFLSLLEDIDGLFHTGRSTMRIAGCSAVARFRQLPPMQERIHCAAAIANSHHSVKMSVVFCQNDGRTFCMVPTGDRTISSADISQILAYNGPSVLEAVFSSRHRDERGLNLCR